MIGQRQVGMPMPMRDVERRRAAAYAANSASPSRPLDFSISVAFTDVELSNFGLALTYRM